MTRFRLLVVAFLMCAASLANGGTIAQDSHKKEKGGTTGEGSYKIEDEKGEVKISVDFSVTKTGTTGVGKADFSLQILDQNCEPVFSISKGFEVRAKAATGANKKEYSDSVTVTGQTAKKIKEGGICVAFCIELEKDAPAFPSSAKEWKDTVKEWPDFAEGMKGMKVGDAKVFGGWQFKRLK
jgi:hypothetical protein